MNILNATQSVSFSSRQYRGITYVKKARGFGVRFPSVEDGLKQCAKDHNLY